MSKIETIENLQNEFDNIKAIKDYSVHLEFLKKLKESDDKKHLDFHYELLKEQDINEELFQLLRRKFTNRGPIAEDYLLEKITMEANTALQGDILQMLGGMKYYGGKRLDETAEWARLFLKSDIDSSRCRAIWVLGWLGTTDDIDLLSHNLFNDISNENRGWAATAFMQIFFSNEATAKKSFNYLKEALKRETDYFTLEMILVSIQEITGKKLGLSSSSRERAPNDKVDRALKRALKL